jgi:hypothetical protein
LVVEIILYPVLLMGTGRRVGLRPKVGECVTAAEFERDEVVHFIGAWHVFNAVLSVDRAPFR